ncbi:Nitroalkane oxidase [Fusarium oxysporum f. sp. albedinis]|nr:Nitroalkane oxidase [Fusarium oxysporum f. sp. albedinis]
MCREETKQRRRSTAVMPIQPTTSRERSRCAKACVNCRRRKQRCDGNLPCGWCRRRRVVNECNFARSPPRPPSSPSSVELARQCEGPKPGPRPEPASLPPTLHVISCFRTPPDPRLSRLFQDGHGNLRFMGDSANLSFLQVIRRLVCDSLGPHLFPDEPLWYLLVEAAPAAQSDWIQEMANQPPPRPTVDKARCLISWYSYATNSVLRLYDQRELNEMVSRWLQIEQDGNQQKATSAVLFLVFAIGAQTCPGDQDDEAERYFNYGRFLAMSGDLGISTIQANILITLYLLGASRKNAAYVYLGTAVRTSYVLGLHSHDVNVLFDPAEFTRRENLWTVLRILDLFMSASLGRPPSTLETRDTAAKENYSTANDICYIFEKILTDVYSKRKVSTHVLQRISERHRQWAERLPSGPVFDEVSPGNFTEVDGKKVHNIALLHVKEAYYWTIMLLTRPFLVENVSKHLSKVAAEAGPFQSPATDLEPEVVAAYACVDSAIRTVDLLRGLGVAEKVPKRLPLVVNSLFIAALVLGLAQFGDLDGMFPIEKGLAGAQALLGVLGRHDAVARSNLAAVTHLRVAGAIYLEERARRRMERQSHLISGLFGTVHGGSAPSQDPMMTENVTQRTDGSSEPSGLLPTPATGSRDSCGQDVGNSLRLICSGTQPLMDLEAESFLPDLASVMDLTLPMSPRPLMFDLGILPFSGEDISEPGARNNM